MRSGVGTGVGNGVVVGIAVGDGTSVGCTAGVIVGPGRTSAVALRAKMKKNEQRKRCMDSLHTSYRKRRGIAQTGALLYAEGNGYRMGSTRKVSGLSEASVRLNGASSSFPTRRRLLEDPLSERFVPRCAPQD